MSFEPFCPLGLCMRLELWIFTVTTTEIGHLQFDVGHEFDFLSYFRHVI